MCGVEDHLQDTWALVKVDKMIDTFWKKSKINYNKHKTKFEAYLSCFRVLRGMRYYAPWFTNRKTEVHEGG